MKAKCPICDQEIGGSSPREWPAFPFCSERCRLVDLGRWLGERYRITARDAGADDEGDFDAEPMPPS